MSRTSGKSILLWLLMAIVPLTSFLFPLMQYLQRESVQVDNSLVIVAPSPPEPSALSNSPTAWHESARIENPPDAAPLKPSALLISLMVLKTPLDTIPSYFSLFAKSCQGLAPRIQCFVLAILPEADPRRTLATVTACRISALPSNVRVHIVSKTLVIGALSQLGANVTLIHSHKIIDFRPAFASLMDILFPNLLERYTHWGWVDIDLVLGVELLRLLDTDVADVQTFSCCSCRKPPHVTGQLTLFRNQPKVNNAWRRALNVTKFSNVFQLERHLVFDEEGFHPHQLNLTLVPHWDSQSTDFLLLKGNRKKCSEWRGPVFFRNGSVFDRVKPYVLHHMSRLKHSTLVAKSFCQDFVSLRFFVDVPDANVSRLMPHQFEPLLRLGVDDF